ncbi:translation initiation factor IF-3 [Metamycoplasma hyosynoviae]|uniref:translation initiation factor IF-3 n=1 Tax=Metamycoplasma hyosynoviae TaxID=29559 RepID=UPI002358A912|nr:translation initiation factor IF-3 [Metamycoplasma hyosynoviae]MDC8937686.1 translation initiation factor IF-3 [Metamycoplasma hyosynoviae]
MSTFLFDKEKIINNTVKSNNLNSRLPKAEHVINENIPYKKIFVISETGEKLGVMTKEDAISHAEDKNLDLVLIALDNNKPIARLMDYGKFKYEKKKKQKINKEKQTVTNNREIRLTPLIGDNDLKTKAKKAREFILNGDRVKISVKFRGREKSRTELGTEILDKFFALVEDIAKITKEAILQNGKFLDMFIEKDKKKIEKKGQKDSDQGELDAKNED